MSPKIKNYWENTKNQFKANKVKTSFKENGEFLTKVRIGSLLGARKTTKAIVPSKNNL